MATSALLAACGRPQTPPEESQEAAPQDEQDTRDKDAYAKLALDMGAWRHDDDHDVYYQLGVPYGLTPASKTYGVLNIYVPGPYFKAEANGSIYKCEVNAAGRQGPYDAAHAPVVMPVDCPDFSAQQPAATYSYEGLKPYLDGGCIYVLAGCRGRSAGFESRGSDEGFSGGAPWALVDLKCAVRFLRYNGASLPGGAQTVVPMGFGAGGCLGALLGTTGDDPAFENPLKTVGAALWNGEGEDVSDAVSGVVLWNPQVSLGTMDGAYEWLYGQYAADGTRDPATWTGRLSTLLAGAWAQGLNDRGFSDGDGGTLTLDETAGGIRTDGTYYEKLLEAVTDGATAFFSSGSFPVTITDASLDSAGFPGAAAGTSSAELAEGVAQNSAVATAEGVTGVPQPTQSTSTTYDSAEAYVASMNEGGRWLTYNARRARARISSLEPFVRRCCPASLACTAYDAVDDKSIWNQLFGTQEYSALHFSALIAKTLEDHREELAAIQGFDGAVVDQWKQDLTRTDDQDLTVTDRVGLYDPFRTLLASSDDHGKGKVAAHWRINVGLAQSQVPFSEGFDLAQALGSLDQDVAVEFNGVWDKGYVLAERTGDAPANALAWVATAFPAPAADASSADGGATEGSEAQ